MILIYSLLQTPYSIPHSPCTPYWLISLAVEYGQEQVDHFDMSNNIDLKIGTLIRNCMYVNFKDCTFTFRT